MKETEFLTTDQTNVEQNALFLTQPEATNDTNPKPETPTDEIIIRGLESVELPTPSSTADTTPAPHGSIHAPKIIDPAFLKERDREKFDELVHKARAAETAHYVELRQVIPRMAGQAVMSSALAGDIANHDLIALNYLGGVESLSHGLTAEEKRVAMDEAVEALRSAPSDNEVISAQRAELQTAESLLQQKTDELKFFKKMFSDERDVLLEQYLALDESDPLRKQLEVRLDTLNHLIGYNSHIRPLPTDRTPTTGELEESTRYTTPGSFSPARGIAISKSLAKKAFQGVRDGFKKGAQAAKVAADWALLDESILDDRNTKQIPIAAQFAGASKE